MWSIIANWLSAPLKTSGNAFEWFLFVGLLLACLYLWGVIGRDWEALA